MTKALSHQGLNAINKVKAQTTNAERKPPIKYPAPTTKTIVAIAAFSNIELSWVEGHLVSTMY